MEDRGQFTFWRSIYDSISLLSAEDQLPLYTAVCRYALDGEEPENLSNTQLALFLSFRPVLANGRKKAANGKQNGSKTKANKKQNGSKPKSKSKQTVNEREKEREKEKEKEIEIENEIEIELKKEKKESLEADFETFWSAYPRHTDKPGARKAFAKVTAPVDTLVKAIEIQKQSRQWQEDGGKYIPYPATWLNRNGWEDELPEATDTKQKETIYGSGSLGEAELEAIRQAMAQPTEDLPWQDWEVSHD